MEFGHKTFTIADPRNFDGNPFEVAERSVAQLAGMSSLLLTALEPAKLMARNAEMERQLQRGERPSADKWEESAEGRRFAQIVSDLEQIERSLNALRRSAGFDPKHPPKV